jgi:hypothetical protein
VSSNVLCEVWGSKHTLDEVDIAVPYAICFGSAPSFSRSLQQYANEANSNGI